ncbi:MAG: CPBP family glutamic-type intramembrane protease [Chloroflexota bacterium]
MADNRAEKPGLIARLGIVQATPAWGYTEAGMALAVLLIGMLIIGSGITVTVASNSANPDPLSFVIGWLVGLTIVIAFVLIRWRSDAQQFAQLWSQNERWHPFLGILVGIAGTFTAAVIVGIGSTDFLIPLHINGVDESNVGVLLLVCAFTMLVLPFAEGLVFFGIVQPRLRASLSGWVGLLTTILLYTLTYFMIYGAGYQGGTALWYGVVYPAIIGFTLGAVRVWSGSTVTTVLAGVGVGISVMVMLLVL